MKINTVWAAYFSATDTTKTVVTQIAKELARHTGRPLETFDFTLAFETGEAVTYGLFNAQERGVLFIGAGTPVYAGRVPNLLIKYVASVQGNGALAVPVVCYGNRHYDDALMELRNTLRDGGFHPVAGAAFSCQHAFSPSQNAGRPDISDLTIAAGFAYDVFQKVEGLTDPAATVPVAVPGNDPVGPYYTPRDRHGEPIKDFLKAKPVTDPDKCVKCGLCARLCPMGSIDPADVSNVAGKCIKCCACVKKCPTGAKYFDHEGYLYHQHELEDQYAGRRAPSEIFV